MWKNIGYEQCLSFINCQLSPARTSSRVGSLIRPAITISRMEGAGGRTIASQLGEYLQSQAPAECQWTIFDKQLIERALEDHHLPRRIAEFMPENHRSMITDMMEELLGLHPSSWTLAHQTMETIMHLAKMGNVILLGRGASVIASKLENAFHVRLIGSLEKRVERVQKAYKLDQRSALEFIHKEDKGRRRYLKEFFDRDIDDPLLYHLIINTDRTPYEDVTKLIGDEVIRRFQLIRSVAEMAL